MAKITAIIDIGSNSARMAIFEKTSHLGFHLLYEAKSKVRISESTYAHNGYLQPIPMERAICALKDFLRIAKIHKARKIICVATSAVRDAPNKADFLRLARKIGLNIKVITGEQEAYFGALSALNLLPYTSGITIDIGGGSTECALIENHKIIDKISLDIGTIRLKELFFDKGDLKGAKDFVQNALLKLPNHFKHERIFGIGGTARALSKSIQKRIEYPLDTLHAFEYDFFSHAEFFRAIYSAKPSELPKLGIKEDRIDSIQGGALIFHLSLLHFEAQSIITSGVGVREGVFLNDLLRNENGHFPPNFNPSVRNLKDRFQKNTSQSNVQKLLAMRLFNTQENLALIPQVYKKHLSISAELCNIGIALNFYEKSSHSDYILLNALSYGLTHQERLLIATLVRYASKKIPESLPYLELLPSLQILKTLSFFVGLSEILSQNENPSNFHFILFSSLNGYTLQITHPNISYLVQERLKKLPLPSPFSQLALTSSKGQ
ncbi:Ppx/GppA phosphatase family protein [Helicobacter turcicus]|uniref:Ppx/GppA family phosphatase n=1 Tax=Helicobacter turcicus TaxID=2867412 RepID=A0ABS7JLT9_9HELI|nr:Ppx/GppA phosphatase family protein [Helicobacter turcicus]MBX7490366.1 Ppx/GppA family phosphatase [Helicobacter turcicus]MBX7545055.1 Ppx/GppA family phosphatase [Helicobacter turcicus]